MTGRGGGGLAPALTALLWLASGCSGKEPTEQPPVEHELPQPIDFETTGGAEPTRPTFACYGEIAFDDQRDGVIDGYGFDGYDEANPTWLLYSARDSNGNGLLEYVQHIERDADGNPIREERERSSAQIIERTYDERGNVLTETYDYGSDGTIEYAYVYTWDANDELLHYERDDRADGILDYALDYERTPEGLRLSASEDSDGNGVVDNRYVYTYDDVGRQATIATDEGADDVIDALRTYTYTDAVLAIGGSTVDQGNDGTIDQIYAFEYDENGLELYYATDRNGDGTWEEEEFTTRNASGRVLNYLVTGVDTSGPYEADQSWTYDALGRTVQYTLYYMYGGVVVFNEQQDTTFGGSCP